MVGDFIDCPLDFLERRLCGIYVVTIVRDRHLSARVSMYKTRRVEDVTAYMVVKLWVP